VQSYKLGDNTSILSCQNSQCVFHRQLTAAVTGYASNLLDAVGALNVDVTTYNCELTVTQL